MAHMVVASLLKLSAWKSILSFPYFLYMRLLYTQRRCACTDISYIRALIADTYVAIIISVVFSESNGAPLFLCSQYTSKRRLLFFVALTIFKVTSVAGCMNSLDWTTRLDYWTGLLDWTTGLIKNVVFFC